MSIAARVLDASPRVTHLTMEWCDLPDQSRVYANLTELHLILERSTNEDRKPFDVDRLAQLVPGLRRLETSAANLIRDQRLLDFIWEIIPRFPQLVHLVINKGSQYPSKPAKKDLFLQLFTTASENRGYNCNTIHLRFCYHDEINICL